MKNNMNTMNIFRTFAALAVISTLMTVSCNEPAQEGPSQEQIKPVFPDVVVNNEVTPGEALTLTFEANMDWSVSVPSANLQWFWIQDSSFKLDKVSGKVEAGSVVPVTVTIGVSDQEEFDANRSCEVTLTMGEESKVIAKYMRPAKNRTLSVYAATVVDGELVSNEDGGYQYETSETSQADLIWSANDADFRMPVRVESNCEWTLETPEWLSVEVPEMTTGTVDLVLTGSSVELATGSLVFKAGDSIIKELNVTVPSCGEVKVYATQIDELGYFQFDEDGNYLYTVEPVEAMTLVWPGNDYRMPVKVDAKCDWTLEMPEWLKASFPEYTPEKNSGTITFTLMGDPLLYPLEDTAAKIFFKFDGQVVHEVEVTIPGVADRFSFSLGMAMTAWEFNAASELMTSAGFQAIPATASIFGTSVADVVAVELVDGRKSVENPSWVTLDVQAYVKGSEVLQTREVSVTTAVNEGSERSAYILFCKDGYASDKFFTADGTIMEDMAAYAVLLTQYGNDMDYVTMTSTEADMAAAGVTFTVSENPRLSGWFGETDYRYELTYTNVYARDKAYMSFAKPFASYKVFNASRRDMTAADEFWLTFTSDDNTSGVIDMYKDMTPSTSKETGYVVFYDADGSTLAIVVCVFDPAAAVSNDVVIEFTEQSAMYAEMMGFTLEHLTSGPIYDEYFDGMSPVYHLTYTSSGMPMSIKIPSNIKKHTVNPYSLKTAFRVNDTIYDEYFGPGDILGEVELSDEGSVEIYMSMPEGNTSDMIRGDIVFMDSAGNTVVILVCTLDLTE